MLNDRDDKFEGHEDSEYHFSDEEVSYEVESPKSAVSESKGNPLSRLTGSKRMMISAGVFFVLVLVAYKMISPATISSPGTDITPPAPAVAQQNMSPDKPIPGTTNTQPAPAVVASVPPVIPVNVPVPDQNNGLNPAMSQLAAPAQPQPVAQSQLTPQQQMAAQQPAAQQQQMPQQQTAAVAPPAQSMPSPPANQQPAQQQMMPQQQSSALTVVTGMPPVIPVQPAAPVSSGNYNQPPTNDSQTASMDAKAASLAVENEKLIGQLQSDVTQKISDYQAQNKNLTDQVQVLNTRIAGMETQMNQLVQTLSHQNQAQAGAVANINTSAAQPQQAAESKIAFNVQAIIPGRAWLRSDSGETVTVAEGDVVKDLGRVTKIDPYDGVVEINTGSKVVSLSYGNGG